MKKAVLLILDGWGERKVRKGNAIVQAHPKYLQHLLDNNPSTLLHASGRHVGLIKGYIGNSEVGHLHLGAGRLVEQDLPHILREITTGKINKNPVLVKAMKKAKKKSLHLLGLISDAGVHSHIKHLLGLMDMADRMGVERVYIHAITDGRDVAPKSALKYLRQIERKIAQIGRDWVISTVMGRYYAMDRDNRWNREHKAYAAMVDDEGHVCTSAREAINRAYARGETDEFIYPTNIIRDGDSHNVEEIPLYSLTFDRIVRVK
jgi:2,3-bisphosphoglycerate-independent phosphoglycerate mutase